MISQAEAEALTRRLATLPVSQTAVAATVGIEPSTLSMMKRGRGSADLYRRVLAAIDEFERNVATSARDEVPRDLKGTLPEMEVAELRWRLQRLPVTQARVAAEAQYSEAMVSSLKKGKGSPGALRRVIAAIERLEDDHLRAAPIARRSRRSRSSAPADPPAQAVVSTTVYKKPVPTAPINGVLRPSGRVEYPCPAFGDITPEECSLYSLDGRAPCRGCCGVKGLAAQALPE